MIKENKKVRNELLAGVRLFNGLVDNRNIKKRVGQNHQTGKITSMMSVRCCQTGMYGFGYVFLAQ